MYLPTFLFTSDTPTASGRMLNDTLGGSSRCRKRFRGKGWVQPSTGTAPSRHLDRLRLKGKIKLAFLPHIPLTFHRDFQKPHSQPETPTLWAGGDGGGEKKKTQKTYYATISALPGQQTCKDGERRTSRQRLRPQNAQVRARSRPLAPPARRAHQKPAPPLAPPRASAPRPDGRCSVPVLVPPSRGNPPEILISGTRGRRPRAFPATERIR